MDTKKILVLSDTHGRVSALKAVLNWAKEKTPPNDTICGAVFLGDGISDLRPAAMETGFFCDWKIVSGNNDYEYSTPEAAVLEFCDDRFYLCHGHRHLLHNGNHSLIGAARNTQANVVMFGHTHVPLCKNVNGILLINPGSVGASRGRTGESFAVVECTAGKQPKVEFYEIKEPAVRGGSLLIESLKI